MRATCGARGVELRKATRKGATLAAGGSASLADTGEVERPRKHPSVPERSFPRGRSREPRRDGPSADSGATKWYCEPRVAVDTIGVLISGRGSNLQAIVDAIAAGRLDARIGVVISNRPEAAGLERAVRGGIETLVLSHRGFGTREDYDRALVEALRVRGVELVCLAGFMRLLSPVFVEAFPNAVLNIHPSLLPAFPGLDAQRQALDHGVKVTGATVHLVTPELDAGPIVLQAPVAVFDGDTVETLSARILAEEHRIYPEAVGIVLGRAWRVEGRRLIRLATEV
jgi:phosphoribosylglycinamide formyltransferase-1